METTTTSTATTAADAHNARLTLVAGLVLLAGTIVFLFFAPGAYAVLLAVHVLAAVIWVGGAAALGVLALVAERTHDNETLVALGKQAEWLSMRVFVPSTFVVLGFGIALVEKGNWGWDQFWIVAALVGWALSAVIGIFLLTPESKQLNALAAEVGMEHPEAQARLKRILTHARIDLVLLILIVLDMAAKPFS